MPEPAIAATCQGCLARVPAEALACPFCATLVHRDRLNNLAGLAAEAEALGRISEAVARYEQMLPLLPPETGQAQALQSKLIALRADFRFRPDSPLPGAPSQGSGFSLTSWMKKAIGGAGAALLIGWKFKFALLALLSKGKLLLLGLTKFSTVASMFAFLGVYWRLYGFAFAFGLVALIYIHEMGHVWAAKRLGIPVTAPMFIPGFGAFIGLKTRLANAVEEAYLGLAGPIWGVAGALSCAALWAVSGQTLFLIIGSFAALMNLFNLIPVWQLDGAHAFKAFSQPQRWIAMLVPLLVAIFAWDGMLLLVSAGAAYQLFYLKGAPAKGHAPSLAHFCALVLVIAIVLRLGGPVLHPTEPPTPESPARTSPQPVIQGAPAR